MWNRAVVLVAVSVLSSNLVSMAGCANEAPPADPPPAVEAPAAPNAAVDDVAPIPVTDSDAVKAAVEELLQTQESGDLRATYDLYVDHWMEYEDWEADRLAHPSSVKDWGVGEPWHPNPADLDVAMVPVHYSYTDETGETRDIQEDRRAVKQPDGTWRVPFMPVQ